MLKNAAIYIADPTMLGTRLFRQLPAITRYEGTSEDGTATGLVIHTDAAQIKMTFMPTADVPSHLEGFRGFARHIWSGTQDDLIYVLARISAVRMVLGCVIEPKNGDERALFDFLTSFSSRLNAILFIYDSIVDFDGEALAGPLTKNAKSG
jgi:hypothetical protein